MKKVVMWTIYALVLAAAGVLVFCYAAFPVETKQTIAKIMEYANTPVAIAGVSTTVGGVLVFVATKYLVSNTKFGRGELDKMKADMKDFKGSIDNVVAQYKDKSNEAMAGFENLKTETEGKITVVYNEFEDLQETMLKSLEAFPNKHIQEMVSKYKAEFANRKEEIVDKTINTNEFVDKKIAEIRAQYDNMFNDLLNKVEKTLNEEGKNN